MQISLGSAFAKLFVVIRHDSFTLCAAAARAGDGLEVGDVSCDSCECVIFLSFHIVRVELVGTSISYPLLSKDDLCHLSVH